MMALTHDMSVPASMGAQPSSATMFSPYFMKSYAVAALRVMSPSRKLNSTAAAMLKPATSPPSMVMRLRLVPGHMAMHCMKPTVKAAFQLMSSSSVPAWQRPLPCFMLYRTKSRMTMPPTAQETSTVSALKRKLLMGPARKKPMTMAGMNPSSRLTIRRRPAAFLPSKPAHICLMREKYKLRTARIAPTWMQTE